MSSYVHISWAGPYIKFPMGDGRFIWIENHRRFGPIQISAKTKEPLARQPGQAHKFWFLYNLWRKAGCKTETLPDGDQTAVISFWAIRPGAWEEWRRRELASLREDRLIASGKKKSELRISIA